MGTMFGHGLFTDCIIIAADGVEFKAHKGVLACQSPVFRAMFEHEMVEAKEGIAQIKDIKSAVLEQMLIFMYTSKAPKLGDMPKELLKAADEYQLEELKVLCEQHLVNSMESETVCEFLIWADRHCYATLKDEAINYITKHAEEVMKSNGYKMLIEGKHVELLDQILKAIVGTKNEPKNNGQTHTHRHSHTHRHHHHPMTYDHEP